MKMPFRDKSFGVVVSISTIEHLGFGYYGDPIEKAGDIIGMKETKRVLKDNGILILTTMYGIDSREPKTGGIDYKTYNKKTFTELMKGWKILRIKYFLRDKNDFWVEKPEKEVAKVKNSPYSHGIVLCVAKKKYD